MTVKIPFLPATLQISHQKPLAISHFNYCSLENQIFELNLTVIKKMLILLKKSQIFDKHLLKILWIPGKTRSFVIKLECERLFCLIIVEMLKSLWLFLEGSVIKSSRILVINTHFSFSEIQYSSSFLYWKLKIIIAND